MKLLRRRDFPTRQVHARLRRVRRRQPGAAEIELTHNWERKEPYEIGTAYGHIAIAVPDIYKTCERLGEEGVKIPRPPGPMAHGGSVIAFIEDPDGYKIELIERK